MSHEYSRGLFFKNYDLYDVEGVDGPAKEGPGTGLHSGKYKSVRDFLKQKRKKNRKKRKLAFIHLCSAKEDRCNLDFPSDNLQSVNNYDSPDSSYIGMMDGSVPQLEDDKGQPAGTPGYGMDEDLGPIPFNPFGIPDGNKKPIDVEPEETKNLYYGILNIKNQ